jgi:hypothetical protein
VGDDAMSRLHYFIDNGVTDQRYNDGQAFNAPTQFTRSTDYNGPSGQYNAPTQYTGNTQFTANPNFTGKTDFSYSADDLKNDPGYQFRMQQANDALLARQVATGQATGGAALKELADYNQGLASQEYNTAYNRAEGTFNQNLANAANEFGQNYQRQNQQFADNYGRDSQQFADNYDRGQQQANSNFTNAYNQFSGNYNRASDQFQNNYQRAKDEYATAYDQFTQDATNRWNRLASLAGIGQTATQQLNNAGANYANNSGDYLTQGANAKAAGAVSIGNAATGALANLVNNYSAQQYMSPGSSYSPSYYNSGYANQGAVDWDAYDAGGTPGYADPYRGGY